MMFPMLLNMENILTFVMPLHHHLTNITACINTEFPRPYASIKHDAVRFLLNITRSNQLDTTVIR